MDSDSLLSKKIYGDVAAYPSGLVEEDATLLTPFANKCKSLGEIDKSGQLTKRVTVCSQTNLDNSLESIFRFIKLLTLGLDTGFSAVSGSEF